MLPDGHPYRKSVDSSRRGPLWRFRGSAALFPHGNKTAFLRATGKFKVKGQADIPSMPGSMLNLTVSKVAESKTGSPATFSMLAELIQKAYKVFCHPRQSR